MLESLNRWFSDGEDKKSLVLATLLDPRFKDKFFSSLVKSLDAKMQLEEEVKLMQAQNPTEENKQSPNLSPSSPKQSKLQLLDCFSEILEEAGASLSTSNSEVDNYIAEPLIPFNGGNSYKWLSDNNLRFHTLTKLAKRYLSAPPTSVPSERLFFTAGDIYHGKRNRLVPERAEMLLFIKNNLPVLTIHQGWGKYFGACT